MYPRLQRLEARPAAVERHDLAVEYQLARTGRGAEPAQLRIGHGHVLARARDEPQEPATAEVGRGAHPVPLHLVRPAPAAGQHLRARGQHRAHPFRQRHPFAVDHPVVFAGPVERVATGQAAAVQHHLDLARRPFHQLVATAIPDADGSGTVFAPRDDSAESRVGQRVVLRAAGEMVAGRVVRHALRYRPGGQHPVMFQAEIPMQPAGVMLLHHEDAAPAGGRPRPGPGGQDHFRAAPGWRRRWPGRAGSSRRGRPASALACVPHCACAGIPRGSPAGLPQSRACAPARAGRRRGAGSVLTIFHYSAPGHPGPAAVGGRAPSQWPRKAPPRHREDDSLTTAAEASRAPAPPSHVTARSRI